MEFQEKMLLRSLEYDTLDGPDFILFCFYYR
jgi:hypothetical protein